MIKKNYWEDSACDAGDLNGAFSLSPRIEFTLYSGSAQAGDSASTKISMGDSAVEALLLAESSAEIEY